MSHTPQPPPGGGEWGPPPAQHTTGTVVVPPWLASDWGFAVRMASLAHGLLIVGAAAITVLAVLQVMATSGLDSMDWGAAALSPLIALFLWFGGGTGEPIFLTGAVYLFLTYLSVARRSPGVGPVIQDRTRAIAAALKTGLVGAGLLLIAGILVNSLAERLLARSLLGNLGFRVDLTSLVFTSALLGTVATLLALMLSRRVTLTRFLGLSLTVPSIVTSGVQGGRRALVIAGIGLLALSTLGTLLDTLTGSGTTLGFALAALLQTIITLVLSGLDNAMLLLLGASKFLHDGGYVWAFFGSVSGWMWLAIPIMLGAYLAGGVTAARAAAPRSQAEAAKAALLVGPAVAAASLLVAIGWAGQPFIDDIVPIAIFLPSLWGVVSVAGAWLWANQQGLPSGIVVQGANPTATHQASQAREQAPPSGWAPPATTPEQPWAPPATQPGQEWAPPRAHLPDDDATIRRVSDDETLGRLPPPDPGGRRDT